MKINIKSLLTGTTLVVASTTGIMADPPKGIELIDGATVTHPIFGEMRVISHKKDIGYYNGKTKYFDSEANKALVNNFMAYVLDGNSYKGDGVSEEGVREILDRRIAATKSGRGMLKVITANYMREYDRIGEFCKANKEALAECYEESLKHKAYLEHCCLTEKLKRDYEIEVNMSERETNETFASMQKEGSECVFQELYKCFNEELGIDAVLGTALNVADGKCKQKLLDIYVEKYFKKLEAFYNAHKFDLEKFVCIQKAGTSEGDRKFTKLCEQLANKWNDAIQKQQEENFSCIRRQDMPGCYFPILYAHFAQKDEKYSDIKDVNNYLFRTLRLVGGQGGFGGEKLELGVDFGMKSDMYYVDDDGGFFDKQLGDEGELKDGFEKYSALHHELIHFMNACCIHNNKWFRKWNKGVIETKKMGLQLSCNDFKQRGEEERDFVYESEFVFHKDCFDDPEEQCMACRYKEECLKKKIKELEEVLCDLYDNNHEMWTMYGILFTPTVSDGEDAEDGENSDESDSEDFEMIKGEFYYDPINEAVSNAECKFFGKAEKEYNRVKMVRTGHIKIKKSDKSSVEGIKILAEKKNIYGFYFDKNLRDWLQE